jgi:predicted adenine nucleotide alpha hydrolase (AANH) superfamily ATPase
MKDIIVDICCGPCSLPLLEIYPEIAGNTVFLLSDFNVHPLEEYEKRKETILKVMKHYDKNIVVLPYNPSEWEAAVYGLEGEPEGGKRCERCYRLRLEKAAQHAADKGIKKFTTTITTGPMKEASMINSIGKEIAKKYGLEFLDLDLKKGEGHLKGLKVSKELGLYRQKYCGCKYSKI